MNQTTPIKLSVRERLRRTEKLLSEAIANANNGTFVANAMFWKLGLKNRDEIKAVVDQYMAHMQSEVEKTKEKGSLQVVEGFIDPILLKKVEEFADSATTDSSEEE